MVVQVLKVLKIHCKDKILIIIITTIITTTVTLKHPLLKCQEWARNQMKTNTKDTTMELADAITATVTATKKQILISEPQ